MSDWDDDDWWDGFISGFIWFSDIPRGKWGIVVWVSILIVLIVIGYYL